jgi:predicted HAD superfamily Cof-like phosphohydrolase
MPKNFRHTKTGGLYSVISEYALNEADMSPVVVYRSLSTGTIWVRSHKEFFDGRFEAMKDVVTKPFQPLSDIREFHSKFNQGYQEPARVLPKELADFRLKFMMEELNEWTQHQRAVEYSLTHDDAPDQVEYTHHLEEQLDALVDLAYVLFGTVHLQGLDHVFSEAWHRVHQANMSKVPAQSAADSKRGYAGDIVKPEGWQPPRHTDLVEVNILTVPQHEE